MGRVTRWARLECVSSLRATGRIGSVCAGEGVRAGHGAVAGRTLQWPFLLSISISHLWVVEINSELHDCVSQTGS